MNKQLRARGKPDISTLMDNHDNLDPDAEKAIANPESNPDDTQISKSNVKKVDTGS